MNTAFKNWEKTPKHNFSLESGRLRELTEHFVRHPEQVNDFMKADAEILRLPAGKELLVCKTDTIHEEIGRKLYVDPYQIGWMAVTAPVSDMAAVNATPTGILLSLVLAEYCQGAWLRKFQDGINAACEKYGIYVLGGDTNFDSALSVSCTAIGYASSKEILLRSGVQKGDRLYATHLLGTGNAFAFSHFFDRDIPVAYQPVARTRESTLIAPFASACIDTSDGLFSAMNVLCEVNHTGFVLEADTTTLLSPTARKAAALAGIPPWMLLAGPHGEYELLFTIPEKNTDAFIDCCSIHQWEPVYLGLATGDQFITFSHQEITTNCLPACIPDLFYEAGQDPHTYYRLLQSMHQRWFAHFQNNGDGEGK